MKRLLLVTFLLLCAQEVCAGDCCVFKVDCSSVDTLRIHKFVAPPANQSPPGDVAIEKYFGSVGLNGDGIEELNRLIENCDKPMVAIKAGNQILKRGPSQSGPLPDKWIVFSRGDEGEARSLLSEVCPDEPIRDGLWE